jgi:hypothetical protein
MGTEELLEVEAMEGVMLGCRGTTVFVDTDVEFAELLGSRPNGLTVRSLLLLYMLVVPCAAGGCARC